MLIRAGGAFTVSSLRWNPIAYYLLAVQTAASFLLEMPSWPIFYSYVVDLPAVVQLVLW